MGFGARNNLPKARAELCGELVIVSVKKESADLGVTLLHDEERAIVSKVSDVACNLEPWDEIISIGGVRPEAVSGTNKSGGWWVKRTASQHAAELLKAAPVGLLEVEKRSSEWKHLGYFDETVYPVVESEEIGTLVAEAATVAAAARSDDEVDESHTVWNEMQGAALESLLISDVTLGGSPVALVDARFLVALSKAGGCMLRRQDLPAAAVLDLTTLRRMPTGNGGLRVLCVSYPWLQPDHPDPKSSTLRLLARVLEAFLAYSTAPLTPHGHLDETYGGGAATWGVFLDFCSLHQKDANGERTPNESALFGRALASLSDLYSHPSTFILKVTKMPVGYPSGFEFPPGMTANTADYYGRGWCFCESSMGNLVKPSDMVLDLSNFSGRKEGLEDIVEEGKFGRPPPLPPAEFAALLETKSFTSKKADLATVTQLYARAFERRVAAAEALTFDFCWWDAGSAKVLCRALIAAKALRQLELSGQSWGDDGVAALAVGLREGAAPELRALELRHNSISDVGVAALAACLREGAAPALHSIDLRSNDSVSDVAAKALGEVRDGLEVEFDSDADIESMARLEAVPHIQIS
jgi:hypothetical protein